MSLITADTKIGKVIQVEGLLNEMQELENDFRAIEGEMHYSECWNALKTILKDHSLMED